MRALIAVAALLAAAPAAARTTDPLSAEDVAAAERAFAAHTREVGIADGFRAYAAPDAIIFNPDPVNLHQSFAGRPSRKGPPHLEWGPLWTGAARSGDMGFSTGPAWFGGRPSSFYFTIWKRQPDGGLKWVLDAGIEVGDAPNRFGLSAPLKVTPTAASGAPASSDPFEADRRLNTAWAEGEGRRAASEVLTSDAWVMDTGHAPAMSPVMIRDRLAARPERYAMERLGGEISAGRDLAYSYGAARWTAADGAGKRGHYVRLWQWREGRWRLLFEEIFDRPEAG